MKRAALLVALLWATACQTPSPFVPLPPDDPRPLDYLRGIVEGAEAVQALRGRAQLAVDGSDGLRLRASQILVLERPAQLRVEVLGLLSQTALVLASDGSEYQLFIPSERSYQSGPVYPELLQQVSGIGLPPEVIVDLVLGSSIPVDEDLSVSEAVATASGEVQLALVDAEGRLSRRMAFDENGRLRRLEAHRDGGLWWGARFAGYERVDGRDFAHEIELDVPGSASRAELSLRDVELNPPITAEVFRLNLPAFRAPGGGG